MSTVRAKAEVTELMGNELFLHLRSGLHEFLARVDARTGARPGMEIDVALDLSRMHAFDPETELSLAT